MDLFTQLGTYGPPYAIIAVLLFMLWDQARRNEKSARESTDLLTKTVEAIGKNVEANGRAIADGHRDCQNCHKEIELSIANGKNGGRKQ